MLENLPLGPYAILCKQKGKSTFLNTCCDCDQLVLICKRTEIPFASHPCADSAMETDVVRCATEQQPIKKTYTFVKVAYLIMTGTTCEQQKTLALPLTSSRTVWRLDNLGTHILLVTTWEHTHSLLPILKVLTLYSHYNNVCIHFWQWC